MPALKGLEGWKEIRVGSLDPDIFRYDESFQNLVPEAIDQIKSAALQGYERIRRPAGVDHPDVTLRPTSDFNFAKGNLFVEVMVADFQSDLKKYLEGTQNSVMRSAKDLAAWNTAHAELALPPADPNQTSIDRSIAFDKSSDIWQRSMERIRKVEQNFPDTLEKYDINVIIGPSDSWFSQYSAATGYQYPLCSLPLGQSQSAFLEYEDG
ncbi:amidase family protein [Metarhizium guizhouense ARSEF 977]|uniref:Amidase family protein n=1 Tax=Metarhizium guizhouense (strain ARSEF 977) TaxID=1276136 RepID=A0A0B4G9L5_METGA|nr:amidase family protein [Metarhizium guizhouense ARSEF 977]